VVEALLLECPQYKDVVTAETEDVLVTAAEGVDCARGYYDGMSCRRDSVRDGPHCRVQYLETEKENACFLATLLLMGVGTTLAEYDERQTSAAASNELHPNKQQKK
jgi:hypothetical protein